jgi:hypothetical protein
VNRGIMHSVRGRVARMAVVATVVLAAASPAGFTAPAGAAPAWSIVASPTPASGGLNYLQGVSCVSATDCTAVGATTMNTGASRTLVERWDGTRWSIVPSPNSSAVSHANGPVSVLYGVSCVSATDCTAVGDRTVDNLGTQTLVEHWDGTRWSIVASPNPASKAVFLFGVSCVTATSCIAVGTYANGFKFSKTLVERWDGARWSIVATPNPNKFSFLSSVSCVRATDCVAVGSSTPRAESARSLPLVLRWNGTRLSRETTAVPGGLNAVSCTSATSCLAVGASGTPPAKGLAARWDGVRWSVVAGANPNVVGLSCVSATYCVAVGPSIQPQHQSFAEQWNGAAWTAMEKPNPTGGNDLRAVSCPSATFCIAVGAQGPAPYDEAETLVEQYTATTTPAAPPIVGIAATPKGRGYWLAASDGGVFASGDAGFYGSAGALGLNKPIVGMAATPSGHGYWLVASDGGIFSFGDARYYGSTGALGLNKPIVGMAATPSGRGYWLVASDGGIFSFGDARFHGSTGAMSLNRPIVGMAATPSGHGYWLVASDGGIFSFGDARFYGSTGALSLNKPIVGVAATSSGHGYWLVASDGGIFNFGDAPFFGSTGGLSPSTPIVGMTPISTGGHYLLVASDGGTYGF